MIEKAKRTIGRGKPAAVAILLLVVLAGTSHAQDVTGSVAGSVVDARGEAVADATVDVIGTRRRVVTDAGGGFRITGLSPGSYLLQATSPRSGTGTSTSSVTAGEEARVELRLDLAVEHDEIVVTANPQARTLREAYTPAGVVDSEELLSKMQPTLGETLAQEPGVSSTAFGQGASRPVIRGFGGDRVRVLDNGVGSGDVSDTSPDHAVALDPFSADRIEILRGPATLMYGSSAEGGVVNVLSDRIPDQAPVTPLSGKLDLRLGSTSNERAGGVDLNGGRGNFAWHLDGFDRDTGNYSSAEGEVPNSQLEAKGGGAGASWVGDRGFLGVSADRFESNYGNPAEEDVHIEMAKNRYDLRGAYGLGQGFLRELKGQVGHNDYEHTEFEGPEVGTRFLDDGWEGRLEALQRPSGPLTGSFGIQVKRRDFEAIGEESFVEPSRTDTWAAFLFEEVSRGPFRLQLGLRHESQDTKIDSEDLPDRSLSATSGSLGGLFVRDDYTVALTVSRSIKLPAAEELYANGPHVATQAFEIGDPDLTTESSLGLDLTLRKTSGRLQGSVSVFANRIDDFIYEQFTGEVMPGEEDDLRVVRFTQRDARFRGAEAQLEYELLHAEPHHLILELGGDYVRAELRETGEPLPRIPPLRMRAALRYQGSSIGASLETVHVSKQDRVSANETETPGYDLVNAALSYRLFSGPLVHDLVLRGTNLTDEVALNHVSFLKDVAPLPGRNLSLSYRMSF